jgi:UDP-4-amino-4-deoxy-L-arabinose-oxoglutarate aminotransferase
MSMISHSRPLITDADRRALDEVLASRMLAQGERTQQFEQKLSEWVGGEGGVAVGRGSAALVLALRALDIGEGDEVVLPTYVCRSVLEAVVTVGAVPVLCDVGPDWVVTDENVASVLTGRTQALIVPHMYGIFADVASLTRFGLPIIEDCAQAVDDKGKHPIRGDIAVFSLHPTKCFTTGEGGIGVTRDPARLAAMRVIRDGTGAAAQGRLFSPLSDLAAALGLSQLSRYHDALARRRVLANRYTAALEPLLPDSFRNHPARDGMYFRYPLKIAGGLDACSDRFARHGVCVRRGVDMLLHRLRGEPDANFKMAVALFETTVSLPLYPALTDEEHAVCVNAAVEIFSSRGSHDRP